VRFDSSLEQIAAAIRALPRLDIADVEKVLSHFS
jgi:hypothetical protein